MRRNALEISALEEELAAEEAALTARLPPPPADEAAVGEGAGGGAGVGAEGEAAGGLQVIRPVLSLFTLLRPYLAHFLPVFPRFLRVFTVSTRRFQQAPSRNPGPRNSRHEDQDLGTLHLVQPALRERAALAPPAGRASRAASLLSNLIGLNRIKIGLKSD